MKYFFNRKKDYLYGFILFVFFATVLLTYGDGFFKEYTPEEKEEIKQEILSSIDADELCRGIYSEVYERIDFVEGEAFEEDFAEVNKYQKDFFIAQELNQDMEEGGVGLYLFYSKCTFVNDLADTLDGFELQEFSNLWRDFMNNPNIDWNALTKEVKEYNDWDETELLKSIYAKYPLKEFDEAFFSLNQDNLFTKKLDKYARANIDQYDYGRISERHLVRL